MPMAHRKARLLKRPQETYEAAHEIFERARLLCRDLLMLWRRTGRYVY